MRQMGLRVHRMHAFLAHAWATRRRRRDAFCRAPQGGTRDGRDP